jgi:AcrR family transcriptional regulator
MTAMTSAPDVGSPASRTRLPRVARRAQLLAAAQEVFVAQGYHAAAMDEIAERAGVSKPVLYQHFPGKLELYLALLDQASAALLTEVHQALASTHDNKQRVAATMAAYFRFVDDDAAAFRLVFESDLTSEAAVRERVETVNARCAEAVSELIAEDAGLSREQAMLLAVALVGMAQVSARYWLARDGSIPRDAAASLVSTLSWRGIRGFPRTADAGDSANPGAVSPMA